MRSETYKNQKQMEISKKPQKATRRRSSKKLTYGVEGLTETTKLHRIEKEPVKTTAKNKQIKKLQKNARSNKNTPTNGQMTQKNVRLPGFR